jgi:hypothetical protein
MIVKIIEPPADPTGLADVFIGVVRFAGVYVLVAIALGAAMAYALFWYRSRSDSGESGEDGGSG